MGRELTKKMDSVNEDYWFNMWHHDFELHNRLGIIDIKQIIKKDVSIYADTDSLFVSFKPCMDHCNWRDVLFNDESLNSIDKKFIILGKPGMSTINKNCIGVCNDIDELKNMIGNQELLLIDGSFVKNWDLIGLIKDGVISLDNIRWNWANELEFIQGMDHFRYAQYFKDCLTTYAESYGVENKEDFELEKISESIINIAKKKYLMHIVHEDGIDYDRMSYIFPKGVELVRSSTPLFARDRIVEIVKYLFNNPDTFNIKELLKLVKNLRKEFELANIDDISMQSSCSNYDAKIIDDKNLPLKYTSGAHFAVKCAAYHNYLLSKDSDARKKYEFIKSGTKIKYYVCKDKGINDMFAYIRGSYPHEFAPEMDYDQQFAKAILSPINSIIEPLGMPQITDRLRVVMDMFSGF